MALGSLFVSVLVGIVPAEKAFSGFADPVVVTVACILVISAAISQSATSPVREKGIRWRNRSRGCAIIGLSISIAAI